MPKVHIFGSWSCPTVNALRDDPELTPSAVAMCGNAHFTGVGTYLVLPADDCRPGAETGNFCLTCLRVENAAIERQLDLV